MSKIRIQKIADQLKQELALLIQSEIRDPRIGMISVTDVTVSRDLAHADIFVTVMGKENEADAKEAMAALNNAAGFLRRELARAIKLRTTPSLKFKFDQSVARGQYLSALIDKAVSEENHQDSSDDEKSDK